MKIFVICAIAMLGVLPPAIHAETMGSIAVNLSYSNGDIADYYPVSLKIYQDSGVVPYREIASLSGNPFNIVSLPLGHQYKIETYANGLHAADSYIELQQAHEDIGIKLPLPGGMRLDVFYSDGVTPIQNATVGVVSLDNKTWAKGQTNADGQTQRFWLEPTAYQYDHYVANVRIGAHLGYMQSPVFLEPGVPQEVKVVTNWPPLVNSLITVKILDSSQKPAESNGSLAVYAIDSNGNTVFQSPVARGESHFSNLRVGDYEFKAIAPGGVTVGKVNATIDGSKTTFTLYENGQTAPQNRVMPPQALPHTPAYNCNCVVLRVDNIQDYWLDKVQESVIDAIYQKNAEQTVGIIANAIGNDSNLVNHIRSESDRIDLAINGWNFEDFTTVGRSGQEHLLNMSKQKIDSVFGAAPTAFIAPFGKADNNTILAMSDESIGFLSADPGVGAPSYLEDKVSLFPTNLMLGTYTSQGSTNEAILSSIRNTISYYGFAVVTINFQNYAQSNGTEKINSPNETRIQELGDLIGVIQGDGIKIATMEEAAGGERLQAHVSSWVKNDARWWSQGQMGDADFIKGMQYLVSQGILKIPEVQAGHPAKQSVPSWVKTTAGWWANGQVSDDEFVKAIQYLVSSGIMTV